MSHFMPWHNPKRAEALQAALSQRILVLDGAMGTMIQRHELEEADYRGERFRDGYDALFSTDNHAHGPGCGCEGHDQRGNNDLLTLTRPDIMRHVQPMAIGLNCALGAKDLRPHVEALSLVADTYITTHPNAGLPNAFGGYDETPEDMAEVVGEFARAGLVNVLGGCCGTTPAHIAAIAHAVEGVTPRQLPAMEAAA